ncbi:MAG: DUF2953 domain-containing protein [Clostridia bacterium]|nr:DUF2953 domain-containing protein [Clostridia bacterium]
MLIAALILGSIALILFLALFSRSRLYFSGVEPLRVEYRFWFIRKVLSGQEEKRKKMPRRISYARMQKYRKKMQKKQAKAKKQEAAEKEKKTGQENGAIQVSLHAILDVFPQIRQVLSLFLQKKYIRRLRLRLLNLEVAVGSPDAARTALTYGAVMAGASGLLTFLDSTMDMRKPRKSRVSIYPDYTHEDIRAHFELELSVRNGQILRYLLVNLIRSRTPLAAIFSRLRGKDAQVQTKKKEEIKQA